MQSDEGCGCNTEEFKYYFCKLKRRNISGLVEGGGWQFGSQVGVPSLLKSARAGHFAPRRKPRMRRERGTRWIEEEGMRSGWED